MQQAVGFHKQGGVINRTGGRSFHFCIAANGSLCNNYYFELFFICKYLIINAGFFCVVS